MKGILGRLREIDKSIFGFTTVLGDRALKAALHCNEVDSIPVIGSGCIQGCDLPAPHPRQGRSPLWGIAVAIKDNICIRNSRLTCGSRMLQRYEPSYDATVVERLDSAGAIIVGQTNMDQFAMGSGTRTSVYPVSKLLLSLPPIFLPFCAPLDSSSSVKAHPYLCRYAYLYGYFNIV